MHNTRLSPVKAGAQLLQSTPRETSFQFLILGDEPGRIWRGHHSAGVILERRMVSVIISLSREHATMCGSPPALKLHALHTRVGGVGRPSVQSWKTKLSLRGLHSAAVCRTGADHAAAEPFSPFRAVRTWAQRPVALQDRPWPLVVRSSQDAHVYESAPVADLPRHPCSLDEIPHTSFSAQPTRDEARPPSAGTSTAQAAQRTDPTRMLVTLRCDHRGGRSEAGCAVLWQLVSRARATRWGRPDHCENLLIINRVLYRPVYVHFAVHAFLLHRTGGSIKRMDPDNDYKRTFVSGEGEEVRRASDQATRRGKARMANDARSRLPDVGSGRG